MKHNVKDKRMYKKGVNCAIQKLNQIKYNTQFYTGSANHLPTSSSLTPRWVPLFPGFTTGSPENLYSERISLTFPLTTRKVTALF